MDILRSQTEEFMQQTFLNGAQMQNTIFNAITDIRSSLPELDRRPSAEFPIFSVPYSRNPRFVGRDEELQILSQQLRGKPGNRLTSCVVHGLGGIGKTQLAIEYAYRARHEYDAIFWMRAETEFELANDYAAIAKRLCLTDPHSESDQSRCVEYVTTWLNHTGGLNGVVLATYSKLTFH